MFGHKSSSSAVPSPSESTKLSHPSGIPSKSTSILSSYPGQMSSSSLIPSLSESIKSSQPSGISSPSTSILSSNPGHSSYKLITPSPSESTSSNVNIEIVQFEAAFLHEVSLSKLPSPNKSIIFGPSIAIFACNIHSSSKLFISHSSSFSASSSSHSISIIMLDARLGISIVKFHSSPNDHLFCHV